MTGGGQGRVLDHDRADRPGARTRLERRSSPGQPFYPDGLRLDLELRDERRFGNGVVYVSYEVRS